MLSFTRLTVNMPPRVYRCEPGWQWSPPPLPDYDLWCVLDGLGEMRLDGEAHPLLPGICSIVPPGATPRATQNRERRLTVFACHFDLWDADGNKVGPEAWAQPRFHALRDRALLETLAPRCEAAWLRGDGAGERLAITMLEQLILHLCVEASEPDVSPVDLRLREMARTIRAEPGRDWGVDSLAEVACLSRSQFTRRFTSAFGVPPAQFVVQVRLERAAQLVRETAMSLTQIADALGYRDLYYFSRQFKQRYGVPPTALRRRP